MPSPHQTVLAAVLSGLESLAARVVLRRCVPGDRWRTQTLWADSDESAVASAEREFQKLAARMTDGGLALVIRGKVKHLTMMGA